MASLLFPQQPRSFPLRRACRSLLRTAHILSTGVLLGGHVFAQPRDEIAPWLAASILTGLVLFATDLHATCAILLEVRGLLVLLKIGALALVHPLPDLTIGLLVVALFIGGIGSHMPGKLRYHHWLGKRRAVSDTRSG